MEVAGPGEVGAHVGVEADAERAVTHLFASLSPAYVGWRWAVTVTRASRSRQATVSEAMLLPGPDSLLAPAWVPWTERVRPGDLKAGDLMPAAVDDERLIPAIVIEGAEGLLDWDASDAWTLGAELPGSETGGAVTGEGERELPGPAATAVSPGPSDVTARPTSRSRRRRPRIDLAARPVRVLSAIGRDEAAQRWYLGSHGPSSPIAAAAPDHCLTCGFLVGVSGPLGRIFGVCANEYSPSDGQVVSFDHGCGAHSDPGRRAGGGSAGEWESEPGGADPMVDEVASDLTADPGDDGMNDWDEGEAVIEGPEPRRD